MPIITMIKPDVSSTNIYILSDQGKDRCDVDRNLGIIYLVRSQNFLKN